MKRTTARRLALPIVAATALGALLGGCGAESSDAPASPAADGTYPATVETAYGEVTLEKKPERILVLSPMYADITSSLGVAPVVYTTNPGETEEKGIESYPWLGDLDLGEHDPDLLTADYTASAEAIALHEPDLIIGTQFQIDEKANEQISEIAPTYVSVDDDDYALTLEAIGTLLGASDQAEQVLADTEAAFSGAAEGSLSGLQGKTFIYAQWLGTEFQVHPAWNFLEKLGLTPQKTDEEAAFTLSLENLDQLDSDVLVIMADDEGRTTLEADPRFADLAASKNEAVVFVTPEVHQSFRLTTPAAVEWTWPKIVPPLENTELDKAG